jgi:hypothetical protein
MATRSYALGVSSLASATSKLAVRPKTSWMAPAKNAGALFDS